SEDENYLYDEVMIKDIQPGDEVLTFNEKIKRFEYQKVKGLLDMGIQEIYEMKTESGKTIRTTGNHPYLAMVGVPETVKQKPRVGIFIDDANMFYAQKEMGWRVDYGSLKEILSQDFDVQFMNYYLAIPKANDQPAFYKTQKFLSKLGYKGDLLEDFNFHPLEFTKFWQHLEGDNVTLITKPLKYIPEKIHFGDGTIMERMNKKGDVDVDIAIDVLNSLEGLDVVILLSGDSDFVNLREDILAKGKKIIFISGNDNLSVELRQGKFIILEKLRKFVELGKENKKAPDTSRGILLNLVYSNQETLSIGEDPDWVKVAFLSEGDLVATHNEENKTAKFEKIVSLKKTGKEQVYDIEVENTHNFVGNDIIAHNTYIQGNLGVGTTAPSYLLSVGSSSQFGVNSSGFALLPQGLAGTPALTFASDTNTGLWSSAADTLNFSTGGSERVRILSDGNVGIGVTAPAEVLDVNGRVKLVQTTAPGTTTDKLYNVSGNLFWNGTNMSGGGALPSSSEGYTLRGNGSAWQATSNLFVQSDGNVGIGSVAPAYLFTVGLSNQFGINSSGYALLPAGAVTTPSLSFVSDTNTGFWSSGADTLNFSTGGSERVRILSDGNVGIGTTAPTSLFHVAGQCVTGDTKLRRRRRKVKSQKSK
ncbi:MAG: NYN domain-containing protein, partial [Patescibacteria group bacterium]